MTIYVDQPICKYGRMIMCHMIAETEEELHAMADKIGIKRKWYQANASHPHYDICKSKRALAIEHGAVEVTSRQLVQIIMNIRAKRGLELVKKLPTLPLVALTKTINREEAEKLYPPKGPK